MTSSNGDIFRVTGEFPSQRPVARSFAVFFDLGLNKQLSKQSRRWWFETQSRPYDVTVLHTIYSDCMHTALFYFMSLWLCLKLKYINVCHWSILFRVASFTFIHDQPYGCQWRTPNGCGLMGRNLTTNSKQIVTRVHNFRNVPCQYIDGLAQDGSNSSANALELLQSCTKPSTSICVG